MLYLLIVRTSSPVILFLFRLFFLAFQAQQVFLGPVQTICPSGFPLSFRPQETAQLKLPNDFRGSTVAISRVSPACTPFSPFKVAMVQGPPCSISVLGRFADLISVSSVALPWLKLRKVSSYFLSLAPDHVSFSRGGPTSIRVLRPSLIFQRSRLLTLF